MKHYGFSGDVHFPMFLIGEIPYFELLTEKAEMRDLRDFLSGRVGSPNVTYFYSN